MDSFCRELKSLRYYRVCIALEGVSIRVKEDRTIKVDVVRLTADLETASRVRESDVGNYPPGVGGHFLLLASLVLDSVACIEGTDDGSLQEVHTAGMHTAFSLFDQVWNAKSFQCWETTQSRGGHDHNVLSSVRYSVSKLSASVGCTDTMMCSSRF